ncbi:MAG: CCA tRNA nucleotidyltransferase [Tissierellia bacterium]|nr:CCA tRNA nucleotidyltransferase [Tissierellia bacterium]
MKLTIPSYVQTMIDRLEEKGYEAYIVGGSVRDMLLGKEPKDYDITTSALPEEIEGLFKDFNTINIGKKFGTIIVCHNMGNVEITTFRKEGKYLDGRRPEEVSFSTRVEDDLSRRDFTINAMAYNSRQGLIDPYEGQKDISRKIIRTVGSPKERFSEDYLRIMRCIRFATELQFEIEKETLEAAKYYSKYIKKVSIERIADEFFKILISPLPSRGIRLLEYTGLLDIVLPELVPAIGFDQKNPHHEMDVYNHILCVLDRTPPILQVRLAALFHDIAKPHTLTIDEEGVGHFYGHDKLGADMAREALSRLKASKDLIEKVYRLVKEHMNHHAHFKDKGLKRLIGRVGKEEIFNLIELQKADIKCSNKGATVDHILEREKRIREILEKNEAYTTSQLDINGRDLMNLGFEEGPILGEILKYLLEKVMEDPGKNQKEILKELALKKFAHGK